MQRRTLSLLPAVILIAAACGGADVSPGSTDATTPAPSTPAPTPITDFEALLFAHDYEPEAGTPGGNVIVSDWQAANQLNFYYSNAFANSQVLAATMRALATVTSDGHWKEDLAASLPRFSDSTIREDASGSGFEVDLALKPGLLWSDGEPLTLRDLAYTWRWVLDEDQSGISTLGWDKIDRIDVADDGLTATVHFTEAYAGYFGLLLGSPPLPQHYMETIPVAEASARSYPLSAAIGDAPVSGPFKYVTASPDTIELVRNDNWKAGADGRAAYLDRVTYRFFPDNKEGMIAAFLAGEIDVATDLLQGDYDAIAGVDPTIGRAIISPAWEYEHFDMNLAGTGAGEGHSALQDIEVRKAIAQAIDKRLLHQTVFPGQPIPDVEPCSNAPPGTYWRMEGLDCLDFDVTAANARLDAAGYVDSNGDGTRDKDGLELVFEHCTSQVGARQLGGESIAAQLKQIGITLNLNFVDSTTVLFATWDDVPAETKCNTSHGNYDTAEFAYVLTFDLFGNYFFSYHTEQIPTVENEGNGFNTVRLSDPEMDAALDTLEAAIRPEEALEAAYTVQEIHLEQLPEVVLYYRQTVRGVSADLHNYFKNPSTASDMWNIEDWFVTR